LFPKRVKVQAEPSECRGKAHKKVKKRREAAVSFDS